MKRIGCFILILLLSTHIQAAPLFPDVPEQHWASDAVRALVAKGLVEGYPGGTFKGDRSASRWEVALVVARLLAKLEQEHEKFASIQDLELTRKLVGAFREELDSLGARVDALTKDSELLERRVSELERITFFGSLETRVVFQSFKNDGPPSDGILNFDQLVGNASGAGGIISSGPAAGFPLDPAFFGVIPVNDLPLGRPLTNGTGLTALARLGLKADITEDIEAGVELAAFTSQGNSIVDAFYGVSAPFLANPFTAQGNDPGGQGLNNSPFTRAVLDNAWFSHKPSRTQVVIGSFTNTQFDNILFEEAQNPNTNTSDDLDLQTQAGRLPNFGVQAKGEIPLNETEETVLNWELIGTRLASSNNNTVSDDNFRSSAFGANVGLRFHADQGKVRFNFLQALDEAQGGGALTVGNIQFPNIAFLNWVNPPDFFFNNLPAQDTTGISSTGDRRPIVSIAGQNNDGVQGIPGVPNFGGFGPQQQTGFGLSAEYTFDVSVSPRVFGEWAHTNYRPQKNSPFSADGDAFKFGAEVDLFNETLELGVEYLAVDPRFSPFILQYPQLAGIVPVQIRTPTNDLFAPLFSLHDTKVYPHNREGITGRAKWWFHPNGNIKVAYSNWEQREASVQDVRFSTNSLGLGLPNSEVLGFSPGFIDPVFSGLSAASFTAAGGNNFAIPLEAPVGQVEIIDVDAVQKWNIGEDRGLTLSGKYVNYNFSRQSNLAALLGGSAAGIRGESQNFIDLDSGGFIVGLDYDLKKNFTISARYTQVNVRGHQDPSGIFSDFAETSGDTQFDTTDLRQAIPSLGFSWDVRDDVNWGLEGKYFNTRDRVPAAVFASPSIPSLNLDFGTQTGRNPFDWSGWQVNSVFTVKL